MLSTIWVILTDDQLMLSTIWVTLIKDQLIINIDQLMIYKDKLIHLDIIILLTSLRFSLEE